MTKGVMRCIGSVQHNNKYGAGYVLVIKWDQMNDNINKQLVKQLVLLIFIQPELREELDNRLAYDIYEE
jgi:guanylate kinase